MEDSALEDLLSSTLDDLDLDEERALEGSRPAAAPTSIPAVVTENDQKGIDAAIESLLGEMKEGKFADTFKDTLNAVAQEMGTNGNMEPEMQEVMKNMFGQNGPAFPGEGTSGESDLMSNMEETLKMLGKTASDLNNSESGAGGEQDALEKLMKSFDSLGDEPSFQGVVEDMMKQLLSRDVLEPAIQDMKDMYPKWLEENKGHAEYERYFEQWKMVERMDEYFQSLKRDESIEYNQETVMEMFSQLHMLGQPPEGIVGAVVPGLEFDEQGLPRMEGMDDKMCSIM